MSNEEWRMKKPFKITNYGHFSSFFILHSTFDISKFVRKPQTPISACSSPLAYRLSPPRLPEEYSPSRSPFPCPVGGAYPRLFRLFDSCVADRRREIPAK
jgi:hypothetical protein